MKKLIYFFIFIILCAPLPVMAGEIHGFFEAGTDIDKPEAYAEVEISYNFDVWIFKNSVYGGWLTWFELSNDGDLIMESINYDLYTIGYRMAYKDIYLQVEHYCRHPEELDGADKSITTVAIGIEW